METMRYSETKKSAKGPIIGLLLFVIIGGAIIFLAVKSEGEPVVVGQTKSDVQRLVDTEATNQQDLSYEVKENTVNDKTNTKIKANMTIPVISVEGEALTEVNNTIEKTYTDMFSKLKEQMASAESKYTYTVTYSKYENMIGNDKILSITMYSKITDDAAKKNTMEKVDTYNIDLAKKQIIKGGDMALNMLGKDYKTKVRDSVKDYVVTQKAMMKEADFTYAMTGLENYYVKDGKLHVVFNEGELVDKKYSVLDITIEE